MTVLAVYQEYHYSISYDDINEAACVEEKKEVIVGFLLNGYVQFRVTTTNSNVAANN